MTIVLTAIVVFSSLLLAVVFALAGLVKLADREGTRRAVVAFGVPEAIAGMAAIVLPIAELTVAVLLLPSRTTLYGALGALTLLVVFSSAITVSLARGRAPECPCFGQLHSAATSWRTLARNGALLALAIVALVGGLVDEPTSAVAWIAGLSTTAAAFLAAGVAVAATIAIVGAVLLSVIRSYGRVLVRLDRVEAALANAGIEVDDAETAPEVGLEPGVPAPWFLSNDSAGRGVSLDDLLAPKLPVLMLFTSPHCGPCAEVIPKAMVWQRQHAEELTIAFAVDGEPDAVYSEAQEFELAHVLVDENRALADAYEASGTPSAVLIAADGTIASRVAAGVEAIETLVDRALAPAEEEQPSLPVGAEAPELELRGLEGDTVPLSSFRGKDTLLLFWNPNCGYCAAMHDDLLAWEESANGVTPRLVVVSSGDQESTRADGFRSTVLLDDDFAAGNAFGVNGTPMAVLLDADGRVSSDVVGGAEAVLGLAGGSVASYPVVT